MNKTKPPTHPIMLNQETYDLLQFVKVELERLTGFEPTNGQAIRHLIVAFYGEGGTLSSRVIPHLGRCDERYERGRD